MNRTQLKIYIFIFQFTFLGCDGGGNKTTDASFYLSLVIDRPSLMLVGDSISAFWPTELLEPFVASKTAFPNRNTLEILRATENMQGHFRACTYNGGANDYLGILSPVSDSSIEKTVSRQKQAIEILKSKCDSLVVLGIWNVEAPWPIVAVRQMNDKMKREIQDEFVLDPSSEITSDMLVDGGHLTYRGYQKLSDLVKEAFRLKGVLIQ
ncbi:SGNH/GDSL hydrolase family protein [Leptospira stimsonii]|uniref:SGNH/GDSL hydrolase family protein n=1 Tax=Leptospira stimsonii TaxID=2202203 RepID=A0A396YUT8_9LEPT|nr:SGNH/GDSL hydrolase family protein [Leptospira stimsonii]RHX86981.1 hypothetical protein DLM75_18555 [Leptospira stimsonii]